MIKSQHGFVLIVLMFILLFVATIGMNTLYLFRSAAMEDATHKQSIQALGIAQSGVEWTLRALEDSTDWVGLAAQLNGQNIGFGSGTFQVGLQNATSTSVTILVTGNVPLINGSTLKHVLMSTALKLPGAIQFALYSPAAQALQFTNTRVYGDTFNGANTMLDVNSSVTGGLVYVPNGNTVSGAGSYASKTVATPVSQSLQSIDSSYYTGLMTNYDTYFSSNTNQSLSGTVNLSGVPWNGVLSANQVTFTGACTIIGNGIIAAKNYIYSNTGFVLNITPSPTGSGTIVLAAKNGIRLYGQTLSVNAKNVILYSQNSYINVWYRYTQIQNALFLTRNGPLDINYGARIYNSTSYVAVTPITSTSFSLKSTAGSPFSYYSGSVMSRGAGVLVGISGTPINFDGLYWNDASTQVNYLQCQGALLTKQFTGNTISNSNISANIGLIPYPPPLGFQGSAMIRPGSWQVD